MLNLFIFIATLSFVSTDIQNKSVSIVATSLAPEKKQEIEFFLVGPGSENDYEAMFMSKANIKDIADAFQKVGFPLGKFADNSKCRFYPSGMRIQIEPSLNNYIKDKTSISNELPEIVFTGGERGEGNSPLAATNMPMAIFAMYNLKQSMIQFNDFLPQSESYGRFVPAQKVQKGKDVVFKFKLIENSSEIEYTAKFDSIGTAKKVFEEIKQISSKSCNSINVTPDFSPELSVGDALSISQALKTIDSPKIKISGFKNGQFYYKSFIPQQSWRERSTRLSQPVEIHYSKDSKPKLIIIKEDWSDEKSMDPKLNVNEYPIDSIDKITKENACFFYVDSSVKLKTLYDLKNKLPSTIVYWYIFM